MIAGLKRNGLLIMNYFLKSKLLPLGLAVGLGQFACSADVAPIRPSNAGRYSGEQGGKTGVTPVSSLPTTPRTPAQAPPPSEDASDADVDPAKAALSVSVSLNAVSVATPGESFFGRGTRLANGSLVVTYGQNADGFQSILAEISSDDGKTWQQLGQIVSVPLPPGSPSIILDPTISALPSGTLMAVYRIALPDGTFRLQASASRDNGRTWLVQGDIDSSAAVQAQPVQPVISLNSRGQAQVYYTKAKNPAGGEGQILMKTSTDEGRTWNNQTIVATRAIGSSSFPAVTRLKDGSVMVAFDTFRGDADNHLILRYVQSGNDGLTWSSARDVYVPADGQKNAQSPQITILEDGRPVVMFMSNEDSGAQVCCTIKMMMTQNVPAFNDVVWQAQPVTGVAGDALFPAAVPTKDGSFLLLFERGRKILMNRVSIKGGL